jgi:hypothetical protein
MGLGGDVCLRGLFGLVFRPYTWPNNDYSAMWREFQETTTARCDSLWQGYFWWADHPGGNCSFNYLP